MTTLHTGLRRRGVLALIALALALAVPEGARRVAAADLRQLQYVVILSRHGVRSPTWSRDRLNQYSAEPWPDFGVTPGDLTAKGRRLMVRMGAYYRTWLQSEKLWSGDGCGAADRLY